MSILNVNQIQPVGSGQTITISASDITASSATITASSVTATTVTSSSTSTFSSGLNVTGGSVGIGTDNPGDLLTLYGTDPSIKLQDSSGDAFSLIEGDNTDEGSLRFRADPLSAGANTHIRFDTDGSERLRITSSGNIGIGGITDPGALLHLRDSDTTTQGAAQLKISKGVGSGAAPSSASRTNCYIHLGGSEWRTGGGGHYLMGFGYTNGETGTGIPAYVGFVETSSAGYTNGDLIFGTRPNTDGTNNPTERLRITSGGNVQIANGNLVFSTSGTGIDFSATSDGSGTVQNEVLAEYERGTWTPALASLTGGTTPVVTTTSAAGQYVRIGAMVYIEFLIVVSAVTTQGTGNIGVTGLPFTNSGGAYRNNIGITYNDIWDTAWREMYVTGSSLQMIPLGVTQSNAYYGTPANDSQSQISTGYFSAAGWYMRE